MRSLFITKNEGGTMNIIDVELDKLKPYENNPRFNDEGVEKVANSIKQFGFKVPIIIDSNNVIIAGHTRLKAAKQLGMDKVPCIIASDLTEEQIKAFRLADNKVSEFSSWDYEKLEEELTNIVQNGEINIDSLIKLGFESDLNIDNKEIEEALDDFFEDVEIEPEHNLSSKSKDDEKYIICPKQQKAYLIMHKI